MTDAGLHEQEKKHIAIAQQNNNTFEKFIAKYGNKSLEQVSNANNEKNPLMKKFRGPESDRYILDPKDPMGRVIDIQHVLAAAQVPGGLGQAVGFTLEVRQFFEGFPSAFLGEDFKANWLGEIFGKHYLYNPKEGATLGEKLRNFFQDYKNNDILFQPVERMMGQIDQQNGQIAELPFSLEGGSDVKQYLTSIAVDQAQPLKEWNLAQIDPSDPSFAPVKQAVIFSREVLQERGQTMPNGSIVAKIENYTITQNDQKGMTLYETNSPNAEPLALVNYSPNQGKLTL
jgi:hypothetical protein